MRIDRETRGPRLDAMAMPMIGVIVMLLIAAMVLAPAHAGHLKLPVARMATPVMRDHLTVGVDRDGNIWIPGVAHPGPVPDAQLGPRLRADQALRGDRSGALTLVADRFASYARVQAVLRAAAEAGVRDVELIAECPRGRESLLRDCFR